MVHTFELSYRTNEKKVIKVLTDHYELTDIQELLDKAKRINMAIEIPLSIPGLILASISYIGNPYECFRFHLRIEPESLIRGRRTIDVFDCSSSSVERLRIRLDKAILTISSTLPQSDKWIASRIDFTMNLKSEYVKECVALAKKGKDPYRYKDPINKPGSSYKISNSVRLNFYDKHDHITKQVDYDSFDAYLIKEAQDIFRIEIQCLNYNKLKHLREKFNLPDKYNIYDYLNPDMAMRILLDYYKKTIGKSDYYSLHKAVKIIEVAEWSNRKKENIKKWLQLIAQAKSVSAAREQFVSGTTLGHKKIPIKGCLNTFRNNEKACNEIGINSVTIPKDWGLDYIPNPIKSIKI